MREIDNLFNSLLSRTVGYEALRNSLINTVPAFPPYNITKSDNQYHLTMALAGYRKDEINVTVDGSELTISGRHIDDSSVEFIYRGIATRDFSRTIKLSDDLEVTSAEFENGLLVIELTKKAKEITAKAIAIK